MNATISAFAGAQRYDAPTRVGRRLRSAGLGLIVMLHAGLMAAFMTDWSEPAARPLPMVMQVSFIAAPPEPPAAEPPPEIKPAPEPPKPIQRMIASPKATPSPIVAAPPEEVPVESQPPAPPPSEAAPTEEPAIVPPSFVAAYLNNPAPTYPYTSKQRREQGAVMLRVLVSAAGRAEQVLIERSSGYARLDEAAAEVVRQRWRFQAAKQGEREIAAWVLIPISFELKNR